MAMAGGVAGAVSDRILTGSAMDAHNSFEAPEDVRPSDYSDARVTENRVTARLPAKSLVVLTIEVGE